MANRVNVDLDMNVQGYVDGMNKATESTAAYETETRKVKDSTVNLNKELRKAKQEVYNLASTYASLDDEAKNSTFGQEIANQLEKAKQKAAEYLDLQSDLSTELRNLSSDTAVFDAITDGLSGMTSGLSAVTGVMGLFTDNTQLMTRAITLFTTAESIANAALKLKKMLLPQEALMLNISRIQQMAATAAVELDTVAKGKNAVATAAATVAQKALNAAAKANPYVLLAGAVLSVVAALGLFTSSTEEAEREQENFNKKLEEGTNRAIEYANAMNSAYNVLLQFMNETGAASWEIEDKKLEKAADKAARLKKVYEDIMNEEKDPRESAEHYEQRLSDAFNAWQSALDENVKLKDEVNAHRAAVQSLIDNWDKLNTDNKIRAGITALQEVRNGVARGTAEYEEYTRRIEILQKKLNPDKVTPVKSVPAPKVNTKDVIDSYEKAIAKYDQLTNRVKTLRDFMNEGRVTPEFVGKFEEEISKIEEKISEISTEWHIQPKVEVPESKLTKIKKKIEELETNLEYINDPDSLAAAKAELKEWKEKQEQEEIRLGYKVVPVEGSSDWYKQTVDKMREELGNIKIQIDGKINPEYISLLEKINALEKEHAELTKTQEERNREAYEKQLNDFNLLIGAAQNFGQALSTLGSAFKDKDLQIAGTIAQAIANITLAFSEAILHDPGKILGPLEWISMSMAATAQLASMIGQIKSIQGYATGGVIGGHSYYGDKILARLNSKELVLNTDQQKKAWDMMDYNYSNNAPSKVEVTGDVKVKGSDLMISIRNLDKKMSKLS